MVLVIPDFASDWLPGKIIVAGVCTALLVIFVVAYFRGGRRL
jgi:hypothetical protein